MCRSRLRATCLLHPAWWGKHLGFSLTAETKGHNLHLWVELSFRKVRVNSLEGLLPSGLPDWIFYTDLKHWVSPCIFWSVKPFCANVHLQIYFTGIILQSSGYLRSHTVCLLTEMGRKALMFSAPAATWNSLRKEFKLMNLWQNSRLLDCVCSYPSFSPILVSLPVFSIVFNYCFNLRGTNLIK